MSKKKDKVRIICRSEVEFEAIFLPQTYEKKKIEKAMREPESFKEHLKGVMTEHIKK
jgi:hypothetical protein